MKALEKAPSTKLQAPEKHQNPNSKGVHGRLVLGAWNFSGAWCLEFGASL
jgi:hypothetical protein